MTPRRPSPEPQATSKPTLRQPAARFILRALATDSELDTARLTAAIRSLSS